MLGTLTQHEIELVLKGQALGRIGCRNGDEIYVIPVTYVYTDGAILCHSLVGQKIEWMRRNGHVGFEVEAIVDHQNWQCVTAQGIYEEFEDDRQIAEAGTLFNEMAFVRKTSLTALPPSDFSEPIHQIRGESIFYRIRIVSMSGRFERRM
jgi:nitroimidazol reductase NimA-like FMN-containing flavoprotein (pyridoxamine 5'-phosphate oxidase superfamily)